MAEADTCSRPAQPGPAPEQNSAGEAPDRGEAPSNIPEASRLEMSLQEQDKPMAGPRREASGYAASSTCTWVLEAREVKYSLERSREGISLGLG